MKPTRTERTIKVLLKIMLAVMLVGLLVAIFLPQMVQADTITGETPLGGASLAMSRFYDKGGSLSYLTHRDEYEMLARIAEAEATGGTLEQKMNVVSCVLARVHSDLFPNSVKGVIFQDKQFSPISDGRYYKVTVTEESYQAVADVLSFGTTHCCLYFCTPTCKSAKSGFHSTLPFVFYDGMHNYYLEVE